MTDLVTGDLHLTDNDRDSYRHKFMATALPQLLAKYRPERLIVLGDLTEDKDRHSAWLVNEVVKHFAALGKLVPKIIIVKGNHDELDEGSPFFRFLGRIPGLYFRSKPRAEPGELFLPHTTNWREDWEQFQQTVPIIYTHNTFHGARSERGQELAGIPLTALRAKRIISGDVHQPQKLGKVLYVGAPYRIYFGDEFEPRMLLVRGPDQITSIKTGELVPQKRLIELASPTERPKLEAKRGDIVKVRVALQYEDVAHWSSHRKAIAEWAKKKGLAVYSIAPVVHYQPGERIAVAKSQSDKELVQEYARVRGIDEATLATGLEFLDE